MRSHLGRMFAVLSILWVGLVIGVSFVATPGKFQADTLSLPIALDVGRHVFAVSHIVQLVIAALLAIAAIAMSRRVRIMLFVALGVLVVQHVVVLPLLAERASSIIDGVRPDGRSPHLFYIMLEVFKVACAAIAGVWSLSEVRDPRPDQRVASRVLLLDA